MHSILPSNSNTSTKTCGRMFYNRYDAIAFLMTCGYTLTIYPAFYMLCLLLILSYAQYKKRLSLPISPITVRYHLYLGTACALTGAAIIYFRKHYPDKYLDFVNAIIHPHMHGICLVNQSCILSSVQTQWYVPPDTPVPYFAGSCSINVYNRNQSTIRIECDMHNAATRPQEVLLWHMLLGPLNSMPIKIAWEQAGAMCNATTQSLLTKLEFHSMLRPWKPNMFSDQFNLTCPPSTDTLQTQVTMNSR